MIVRKLPTSLVIDGVGYSINTDFGDILNILTMFNDTGFDEEERSLACIDMFYRQGDTWGTDIIPSEHWQEALNKAVDFIDMGMKGDSHKPSLMDWEQDFNVIVPAVNTALGYDVREKEYLHWWTFLAGYMEIRESLFSNIISIRSKKQKKQKLEKYEEEFYRENKSLVDMKKKSSYTDEQKEELRALFGYKR